MEKRIVTLASGQFGDIPLETLAPLAKEMGYEGLELATHAHFDVDKALSDPKYIPYVRKVLEDNGLECRAISAHLRGQCVCDVYDERLDNFVPDALKGKPDEIREWAIEQMKKSAKAASLFDVDVVNGFTGSPIWARWYSYPQTTEKMVKDGFDEVYESWSPIFDEFDRYGIKFALEVHPTEIAFDYYTTERLLERFSYRPTLGLNYDPSHLVWQGVDECKFLDAFKDRVYHVHMKDVKILKNDLAGVLGSFLPFGDSRRAWNFVSIGHGDVDFDGIIRILNSAGYTGPLSVEWEDSGMDRIFGARESCEYVKKINFYPSDIPFDSALKS